MSLPTCPTDCTSNLPAWDFGLCDPEVKNGEIAKFHYTTPGNPMSNWASASEWDSRLDQDGSGASKIRTLIGIFQMPKPEQTDTNISLGRKMKGVKKFTITGRIDDLSDANWEAMRSSECQTGNVLAWFNTRGIGNGDNGLLYGGSSGIEGSLKLNPVIPEGFEEVQYIDFEFTWEAKFSPERIASPITNTTGDQF